jgi:hypothetical protein
MAALNNLQAKTAEFSLLGGAVAWSSPAAIAPMGSKRCLYIAVVLSWSTRVKRKYVC